MASDRAQVEIEQAINAAISERAGLLSANRTLISEQLAMARELCAALDCQDFASLNGSIRETTDGLTAAADASESLSAQTADVNKEMKKATKTSFSWKAAGVGAFVAIKNAASGVFGILGSIAGVIKTGVMGAFNLVKMGMQAYNGMIDGLLQKGQELYNGTSAIRQQMEALRGEFGALSKGEGRSIIKAWDTMNNRGQKLSGTGLRLSRVFGSGSEGTAKMLELLQEKAGEMGPVFTRFSADFEKAGEEVIIASKALGLSGEAMASLALAGRAAGKSLKATMQEMNKQVVQVSKRFGVNVKITGQMLDAQLKAPGIFSTNTKEMLKTAVAAQKLGVSIETLTKTTKVFDDFESGAKAAGELAAQFGITVDAMEMMTATPAEQVTMLKDALQESGQSFEEMSRQEKQRLADLTGMDMTELQNLMDPTNAFDSDAMDDVGAGVDDATAATMRQTTANQELAKAMERVIEQGEQLTGAGGLFGAFVTGISKGIGKSEEFRHIIRNVYEVFKIVDRSGQRVGLMLMELFGEGGPFYVVTQFFDNMFDPAKMQQRMNNIEGFFRDFVDTVMEGGEGATGAFTTLFNNIVNELFGDMGGGTSFFTMMLEGLETAFDFIGASLIKFAPTILNGLTKLFKLAIAAMSGELGTPEFGGQLAADGLFPMIQSAMQDPKLIEAWDGMVVVFLEMLDMFWGKYGDVITDAFAVIIGAIITASIIQSLPIILASGAIGGMVKGLFMGIGSGLAGDASTEGPPALDDSAGGKLTKMAEDLDEAVMQLRDIDKGDMLHAAAIMVIIAGAFGLALLGVIELAVHAKERKASPAIMMIMIGGIYGIAKAAEAIGNLMKVLDGVQLNAKKIGTMVLILGLLIGVMWAVSKVVVATMESLQGVEPPKPGVVEAAGDITMVVMTAVAAIVVMGAMLAGIAMLASNPVTATALVLALGAAMIIFWGVAELMTEMVEAFGSIDMNVAQRASVAADAASKLVTTMFDVLDLLMIVIAGTSLDESLFEKAAQQVANITDILADQMMPAMMRAADMITEDPAIIKDKLSIIIGLMDSFAPIAGLMTAALQIKDLRPDQVATVVNHVTAGIGAVLGSISSMVTGIVDGVGGLSPEQIKAAEAAAPLIGAVASLLGAFTMPSELLASEMVTTQEIYIDHEGLDSEELRDVPRVIKTATKRQRDYIDNFVYMLEQIGPALQGLVEKIVAIDIPGDPATVGKRMETLAAIFGALTAFGDALGSMEDLSWESARDKVKEVAFMFGDKYKDIAVDYLWEAVEGMSTFYAKAEPLDLEPKIQFAIMVFEQLGPLINTLKAMPNPAGASDRGTALVLAFAGSTGVFTDQNVQPLIDAIKVFSKVSDSIEEHSVGGLAHVNTFIKDVLELTPRVKEFGSQVSAAIWAPLVDVVSAFNELGAEMGAARNIVSINRTLKAIGTALKIDDNNIRVERGDVTVVVNLKVKLNASTLSQVLVQNMLVLGGKSYDPPGSQVVPPQVPATPGSHGPV